jgi:hypothetical protein
MFMEVDPIYRLLLIVTITDEFYFLKLNWKGGNLFYDMLYNGDSSFSGLKKVKKNINVSIKNT